MPAFLSFLRGVGGIRRWETNRYCWVPSQGSSYTIATCSFLPAVLPLLIEFLRKYCIRSSLKRPGAIAFLQPTKRIASWWASSVFNGPRKHRHTYIYKTMGIGYWALPSRPGRARAVSVVEGLGVGGRRRQPARKRIEHWASSKQSLRSPNSYQMLLQTCPGLAIGTNKR